MTKAKAGQGATGVLFTIAMVCAPYFAQAQQSCVTLSGHVPACMAGTWTGESDMAARLDAMFAGLPDDVWASGRPTSAQFLFMRIESDGWFVASPMSAAADATFLSDSGSAGTLAAELSASGGTGFFTTGGGDALSFCMTSGGFGTLSMSGDGGGATVPVTPGGGPSVPMRQTCAGDSLQMFVDLPPPMGTVTYSLTRIPEGDLPPGLAGLLPARP